MKNANVRNPLLPDEEGHYSTGMRCMDRGSCGVIPSMDSPAKWR